MIKHTPTIDMHTFINSICLGSKPSAKDLTTLALEVLRVLSERRTEYEAINNQIKKLVPDFTPHLQFCDSQIETTFVDLLDEILGDEIASYFLYEGGAYYEKGVSWPIKTYDDVVRYVTREKQKA